MLHASIAPSHTIQSTSQTIASALTKVATLADAFPIIMTSSMYWCVGQT